MTKINKLLGYTFTLIALASMFMIPATTVSAQNGDLFPNDLPTVNITRDGMYDLFINIASLAIFILPGVALLFIIYGAFKIVTGDTSGWALIKNSLIGLAVAGLSFIIVGLATGLLDAIYAGDLIDLG